MKRDVLAQLLKWAKKPKSQTVGIDGRQTNWQNNQP